MLKFNFFIVVVYFFFLNINSFSNENVAFVDIKLILDKTNLGQQITKEIEILNQEIMVELNKQQIKIKNLNDEINNSKNIISREILDEKILLLNNSVKSFNIEKEKQLDTFNNLKLKKKNEFLLKITPLIEEYMNKNSIDFLIEKNNIFIGRDKYNITEDLITEINKKIN